MTAAALTLPKAPQTSSTTATTSTSTTVPSSKITAKKSKKPSKLLSEDDVRNLNKAKQKIEVYDNTSEDWVKSEKRKKGKQKKER
ncbi:20812_t:CDS:2 [Gigaspora margarita]|uniref:20812_t:CDS:1 n=1 Tax=Gigaspora margarita TaxID=4874 RepID=A0ABN7UZG2_GIGMA|nr:20812_t:CDS:2 [Gigaspora margarita]